jgi:molybdate transport system substrate-binding protein
VNVLASYPIATVRTTRNAPTAEAFIAFVTAPAGQAILAKYGFGTP